MHEVLLGFVSSNQAQPPLKGKPDMGVLAAAMCSHGTHGCARHSAGWMLALPAAAPCKPCSC